MFNWVSRRMAYNRGIYTPNMACSECGSKNLVKQLVFWNAFSHPNKMFGKSLAPHWICAKCVGLKEGVKEIPQDLGLIIGIIVIFGVFIVLGALFTMFIGSADVPYRLQ